MQLSPATVMTVQETWARILGLPHESMAQNGARIYLEKSDSPVLMFVSLFGVGVVRGPKWAIEVAHDLADHELASHAKLLEISAPHGGQPLGEAGLFFCDTVPSVSGGASTVSSDPAHALALERACSQDDAAEVGLSEMETTFVLLDGDEPTQLPLAGCGYDIWEASLAHMGVLTAPGQRRQGHAATAVSIAMGQAMDLGLVPQWRARTDNAASIRTALGAGFKQAGSQTTVLLNV